jgi:hypothetical protein
LNKQEQKSKASIMTIVQSRLDKKEKREKTKQFQKGKPVSVDKK